MKNKLSVTINRATKRTLQQIMIVMLAAIGLVSVLTWLATAPMRQKSGFARQFIYKISQPINIASKDPWTWRISGIRNNIFYIQGRRPDQIIRISYDLQHADTLFLPVASDELTLSNFELLVDSSQVWLFAKNVPAISCIGLNSKFKVEQKHFPPANYTRAIKTGPHTFVFRGFDTSLHSPDQIFLKGNLLTGSLQREQGISERPGDAGISTAGLLHYDTTTHLLLYVFFFSNRFLCLDTNLNLRYRGNTIDTLHALQTRGGSMKSVSAISYTNVSPSRIVNRANCVADGKLFNYSEIKADNESTQNFIHNAVIDVYDLPDGQYAGSFYIPDHEGEKLQQFRLFNDTLLVLYKHYMATYRLQK